MSKRATEIHHAIEALALALDPQRKHPFQGDIVDLLEWATKDVLAMRQQLNRFLSAVEHVTADGNTHHTVSTSEGWAMVHRERLRDLELNEEELTACEKELAEAEKATKLCYACNTALDEANDALYQRQGKPTYEQLEKQLLQTRALNIDPKPVELYPCGFNDLRSFIVRDGAWLIRSLHEGEPISTEQRNAVMHMISRAQDMAVLLARQPLYKVKEG